MNIRKVDNGYIVVTERGTGTGREEIFKTLEEVFDNALSHFEGKSKYFKGDMFGKVIILDKPNDEYPEEEAV